FAPSSVRVAPGRIAPGSWRQSNLQAVRILRVGRVCVEVPPLVGRAGTMKPLPAWSPGFSRSKPFEPPEGGTPNQPRFTERRTCTNDRVHLYAGRPGGRPVIFENGSATRAPSASVNLRVVSSTSRNN